MAQAMDDQIDPELLRRRNEQGGESADGATPNPPTGGVTGAATPAAPSVTPYNREQFRDAWMATGTDTNRQNALLSQYGLSADGAGRVALPRDVNGHAAETLDLRIGARSGQNQAGWTDIGQNGSSNGPAAGPSGVPPWLAAAQGAPTPSASAGSMIAPQASQPGSEPSGFQQQVRDKLLSILGQSQTVNPNDPVITSQMDAAKTAASRQLDEERRALAEAQYAQGGARSDALEQGIARSHERVAGQLGTLKGQLMARQAEQMQAQLQQALALAMQSGDSEAARQLQERLTNLQAMIQREGLANQMSIAQMGDATTRAGLANQWNIAQMGDATTRAGLAQGQNQWNDSFGLNAAQFQYLRDRDLMNALLNGG